VLQRLQQHIALQHEPLLLLLLVLLRAAAPSRGGAEDEYVDDKNMVERLEY
jgi:hypothetical protein